MQIGAIDFQPFIYNMNQIDAASLNRVRPVPDDINAERTDYSGLLRNDENTNQLRIGETANFADIIGQQMSLAQQNASRVMVEEDDAVETAAMNVTAQAQGDGASSVVTSQEEEAVQAVAASQEEEAVQVSAASQEDEAVQITAASLNEEAAEVLAATIDDEAVQITAASQEENNTVEDEDDMPYEAVAAEEEQAAASAVNDENTAGTVNAVITEDGAVSAYTSGAIVGNPVENFQLEAETTGAEAVGETVFANVIPDGLVRPHTNTAVEAAEVNAEASLETEVIQHEQLQNQIQANEEANLFQMRRATDAYALAMGF